MKTLTHGTLPSFEEFAAAYAAQMDGTHYTIELNDRDYREFEAAGLHEQFASEVARGNQEARYLRGVTTASGKFAITYDVGQLYRLVSNLIELYAIDGSEYGDWALDFAGGILTTLGFEWV